MNRLVNRNVIVIGGISGIGLATAKQLAAEGAHVTVIGRNREKMVVIRNEAAELAVEAVEASSGGGSAGLFRTTCALDDPH